MCSGLSLVITLACVRVCTLFFMLAVAHHTIPVKNAGAFSSNELDPGLLEACRSILYYCGFVQIARHELRKKTAKWTRLILVLSPKF